MLDYQRVMASQRRRKASSAITGGPLRTPQLSPMLCLHLLSLSSSDLTRWPCFSSVLWQWEKCSSRPVKHCNSQCSQLTVDEAQIHKVWLGNQGLLDSNQTGSVLAFQTLLWPMPAWDEEVPLCPPKGKKSMRGDSISQAIKLYTHFFHFFSLFIMVENFWVHHLYFVSRWKLFYLAHFSCCPLLLLALLASHSVPHLSP